MNSAIREDRVRAISEALECDLDLAADIIEICAVISPEELYAKYIAVKKTDSLFASALHLTPEIWAEMMSKLRAALPEDTVIWLETPLDVKNMPITGWRFPKNVSRSDTDISDDMDRMDCGNDDTSTEA